MEGRLRPITVAQATAVQAIMRLFVEDDLARGVSAGRRRLCAACHAWRSAPGFVEYECWSVCNSCATDYELARLRGTVRVPAEYIALCSEQATA